ncbi:MAG: hypothetical protein MJZ57_06945 [Bacteroidales bacterium]|nr:hypothetical protein [Bacteroidales bacterium]
MNEILEYASNFIQGEEWRSAEGGGAGWLAPKEAPAVAAYWGSKSMQI